MVATVARAPAALLPAAALLVATAGVTAAGAPPHSAALGALVVAAVLAATTWALVSLERFVLVAVLGAMMLPVALVQPAGAQVALVDVLLVLALGGWLVTAAVGAAPAPWITGNPLLAPSLLFAAVTAASLTWSVAVADTVKMTLQIVEVVVLVPLIFASLPRSLRAIRAGMLVYVALTCILALVALALFVPRAAAGDLTGQYLPGLHKNAIGSFLAAGLVLAYGLWLCEARRRTQWALGFAALVEAGGLVATISRGSLLGALVGLLAVSVLLRRRQLLTLALAAIATAGFLLTISPSAGPDPRQPGGYASSQVRGYSFDRAVEKIAERPVLGTGAGTYSDYIPELDIGLRDPNNLFLLTWAEVGLLGLAALGFLLYRFARVFMAARRLPRTAAVPAVAAGGVVMSLLVHFQVDSTWNRGTATLAFAMMGLVIAARRLAVRDRDDAVSDRGRAPARRRGAERAPDRAAQIVAAAPAPVLPERVADTRSLRVVHLLTSDAFAGIERHVIRLAGELRRLGCAAELACPRSATCLRAEAAAAGIPVHPSPAGRRQAWIGALARRIAADPPDILHLHDGRSAVAGVLLERLGRTLVVRTQHFTHPASAGRSGWRRDASLGLHRALNRRLDGYVAVSQSVADGARERREIAAAKVAVIAPGIELPGDEAVSRAQAVRDQLGHPVVAYVGRLEAEKRLDVLLEAVPRVLERLADCRFVIAGAGREEQPLRLLAGRLGIEDAITWAGEVRDPGAVLEGAHLYVNPSPSEGFGLATAEAMALALPVVAIASGGSAGLVEHGATGILVPAPAPDLIAAAIARLAADLPAAAEMGAAGRRRAARYGAEHTARETLALYRRLAEGRRA